MNFISITHYFNKLQSMLFLMLIGPLLVFISLYFYLSDMSVNPRREYFTVLPGIVFADWVLLVVYINKKIKSIRNVQGLGSKLEKYLALTTLRYAMISSASLMMAIGYALTKSDIFTWFFLAGLLFSGILWPTSRKISSDLALRGDEREMVLFKKDKF
jgi:hypothetical protein